MIDIDLQSPYIQRSAAIKDQNQNARMLINSYEIKSNQNHLALISNKIMMTIVTDKTATEFTFEVKILNEYSLNAAKEFLLTGKFIGNVSESVLIDMFAIGETIGNEDLMKPLEKHFKNQKYDLKNVFTIFSFCKNPKRKNDMITFIAKNLCNFERDLLISFLIQNGIDFTEQLLDSSDISIYSNDDIFEIALALAYRDKSYIRLLAKKTSPPLSNESISLLCTFFESLLDDLQDQDIKKVWKMIKFLNPPDKLTNSFSEENIFTNHPTIFTASGLWSSIKSVQMNTNDSRADFGTSDIPGSWVEASLQSGCAIPITYKLMSKNINTGTCFLQSWVLQGTTINNEYVTLDSHNSDPFRPGEIREFPITTRTKFKSFRIIQTGPATNGCHVLCLNVFNISGNFFPSRNEN